MTMLDLRDPAWQFIGVLCGGIGIIIGLLTSLGLYYFGRQRKSLTYDIETFASVLSMGEELHGKVQILYEGQQVRKKIHLAIVSLKNSGNLPILSTDYERPITIDFGPHAQVLTFELTKKHPQNLEVSLDVEVGKLYIRPTLLNQGDWFTVKALVSDAQITPIQLDGRIIGIKKLEGEDPTTRSQRQAKMEFIFTITYIGLLFLLMSNRVPPDLAAVVPALLVVFAVFYIIYKVRLIFRRA